ncbi:hypothetical protein NMS31_001630 [Vibrio cholerae]|nr:hypothetical protein [Vibrio cholerae]
MADSYVHVIAYFINCIGMIFALCIALGVLFKIGFVITGIMAYPVYIALFTAEAFTQTFKKNSERKFFRLNIPETHNKRIGMNISATIVMLCMIPNFISFYYVLQYGQLNQVEAANKFVGMFIGTDSFQLLLNGLSGGFLIVIYCISYFSKVDQRDPMEKIEKLSVPSLWSGLFNGGQ